jgi:hypothetical protein
MPMGTYPFGAPFLMKGIYKGRGYRRKSLVIQGANTRGHASATADFNPRALRAPQRTPHMLSTIVRMCGLSVITAAAGSAFAIARSTHGD